MHRILHKVLQCRVLHKSIEQGNQICQLNANRISYSKCKSTIGILKYTRPSADMLRKNNNIRNRTLSSIRITRSGIFLVAHLTIGSICSSTSNRTRYKIQILGRFKFIQAESTKGQYLSRYTTITLCNSNSYTYYNDNACRNDEISISMTNGRNLFITAFSGRPGDNPLKSPTRSLFQQAITRSQFVLGLYGW